MNKSKTVFLFLLFFYLVLHFAIPGAYFAIFNYHSTYQATYFDIESLIVGGELNVGSCLLGALFIYLTPELFKSPKKELQYRSTFFLIFSVFFALGTIAIIGPYSKSLDTLNAPTGFFITGGMFFNLDFYILFALATSQNFYAGSALLYQIIGILKSSRSTSLVLFLSLAYSRIVTHRPRQFKQYLLFCLISILLSAFSFNFSTKTRSGEDGAIKLTSKIKNSFFINNVFLKKAISRISYLENSMLPIIFKKNNIKKGLNIFYLKYAPIQQVKILLNNLVPGDPFGFDVYPNQYYRAAFTDLPIELAKSRYTSINITLPVYFYMYFGFWTSIFTSAFAIWAYYILTLLAFRLNPLIALVFVSFFYIGLLTFFDLVMLGKGLFLGIISSIFFVILHKAEVQLLELYNRLD